MQSLNEKTYNIHYYRGNIAGRMIQGAYTNTMQSSRAYESTAILNTRVNK